MASLGMKVAGINKAINAITTVRDGWNGDARYVVAVGAEYGAYVEFGTSRMEAQPYLFPAARTVMESEYKRYEAQARTVDDLVRRLALAIERQAKQNAPVDTGTLRSSIEAHPVGGMP